MISCCGLDCSTCEGYLATVENSDTRRKEVAEKWSSMYNADIKPEQINCSGCRSEGVKFHFTENTCEIRKCNLKRATAHCAQCPQYPCDTLKHFITAAPSVGEALEAMR